MKTIWIINHYALTPEQGGLCRHYYFAKELMRRGYNVRIFSSSAIHNTKINMFSDGDKGKFKEVDYDDVKYTYIKSASYNGNGVARIKNMLGFALSIKKIWKAFSFENPDIILTSSPDVFTAHYAEKLAKKHNIPCAVEVRDLWPLSIVEYLGFSNNNPIIRYLYHYEKNIYKNADALSFTMEGGKDYIRDKKWENKIDLNKIFNMNNGLDNALQERQRNENIIDDADLTDETFKVIYTGSIRTANSVDTLISATELLKDRQDIKFLIYGAGSDKEKLEKYCSEHNLTNVKFKGKVDKKYIPYICSRASLNFISGQQTKILKYGISFNKLFDYMGAGKPILSIIKPNYDLIERYDCGISLDEQSPRTIADAVIKIHDMPSDEYNIMCENAKKAALDYDYNKLTDKLEEVIDYAISHHKGKK